MRILQLHTRYRQQGGEDVVVDAEAKLLRDAGHEVRQVVAQNPDGSLAAAKDLALATWNPGWTRRIRREVKEFQPDVAHVHNTWFAMSPAVIRTLRRAGVPVVMTLHNFRLTCANALLFRDGHICEECVGSSPWKAVRYGCYRDSRVASAMAASTIALHQRLGTWSRHVAIFVALTHFQRDLMIRVGLPAEKIIVKPNFVDDPGPREIPASESRIVLYVGRLSPEKGVGHLVEAWNKARPAGLELVVAGDGPLRAELEGLRTERISVVGRVSRERVTELMGRARALVFPSLWYEGQPRVLLEAFSHALPVMSADVGAGRELATWFGADWTVSNRHPDHWVEAVARLTDDKRISAASLRARKLYCDRYGPAKNIVELERIFLSALLVESVGGRETGCTE